MTHCWKDYEEWLIETYGEHSEAHLEFVAEDWASGNSPRGKTCMLPDGHEGPHAWTDDADIVITFNAKGGA